MQILVIGFEGSGVSILRRMLSIHPEISGVFSNKKILYNFKDISELTNYMERRFRNSEKNWVEVVSFYDDNDIVEYCRKWIDMFGDKSKIIHILRHPYDVALTLSKKNNNNYYTLVDCMETYKNIMRIVIPKLSNIKNILSIKYEDLLLSPDEIISDIYYYCGMSTDIDIRTALLSTNKPKFINSLDTSGVFMHKYKSKIISPINLTGLINVINSKVDGEIYEV